MSWIERQLTARETRRTSPGFRAEMTRERAEFKNILSDLGDSSLNFLYTGIGKHLLGRGLKSTAKLMSPIHKKYTGDKFAKDQTKNITKALAYGVKNVWDLVRVSGKAVKIAVRELIGY